MLAVIQFPISDARGFVAQRDARLAMPEWPSPSVGLRPQFVRSFGVATRRRSKADAAWTDEGTYCTARRALMFSDLRRRKVGSGAASFRPIVAFRRLFFDGESVARVEVGISNTRSGGRRRGLSGVEAAGFMQMLADMLALPCRVPRSGSGGVGSSPRDLILQGPDLAKHFARATSGTPAADGALVRAGNPIVMIEFKDGELKKLPGSFVPLPHQTVGGAYVASGWLRTPFGDVSTWIVSAEASSQRLARSLRLCLLRLHAEQECLDLVLKQLKSGRIDVDAHAGVADRLDAYFNRATRVIAREKWGGIEQSAILSAFDAAVHVTPPADRTQLVERYNGARREVWKKIEAFQSRRAAERTVTYVQVQSGGQYVVNEGVIISGSNNVFHAEVIGKITGNIDNSFNKHMGSRPDGDAVKTALAALRDESKKLAAKIVEQGKASEDAKAAAEEVAQRVDIIAQQAAQKKPMSDLLQVSGKGLIDAAKTVAEMTPSITAAVVGVLKIFGVALL